MILDTYLDDKLKLYFLEYYKNWLLTRNVCTVISHQSSVHHSSLLIYYNSCTCNIIYIYYLFKNENYYLRIIVGIAKELYVRAL